jgi:hypothetical protein
VQWESDIATARRRFTRKVVSEWVRHERQREKRTNLEGNGSEAETA